MRDSDNNKLRPIDAFVKYVLAVKPFHTKLLEVIERYNIVEEMNVDMTELVFTSISIINKPLCRPVGFGLIFDECGFSSDSCCDLFQCLGGYGLIWDNSDLLVSEAIGTVTVANDEIIIAGNHTFDRRIEILEVRPDGVLLRGAVDSYFNVHKLFLIAPFNIHTISSNNSNTIYLAGDKEAEFNTKREFKITGSQGGLDGLYGVTLAIYNPETDETEIRVAGNRNLSPSPGALTGAYVETETAAINQGFYPVASTAYEGDNTFVTIDTNVATLVEATGLNMGSVQLRTALTAPRRVWLRNADNIEELREFRIVDSYYDIGLGNTHIIFAEIMGTFVPDQIRLYGYMTSSGFDNNEECDTPKPTNIHTVFGERLFIRVTNIPCPTCGTGRLFEELVENELGDDTVLGRRTEDGVCRDVETDENQIVRREEESDASRFTEYGECRIAEQPEPVIIEMA